MAPSYLAPSWAAFRGPGQNGASDVRIINNDQAEASIVVVRLGGLIWGTAVSDGRRVYVGSTNRTFACIDLADSKRIWSYSISDDQADSLIDSAACLVPSKSLVIVPGGDGFLHGLDARAGRRRFLFQARGASEGDHASGVIVNSFEGNVVASRDGSRAFAGNDNGHLYCIDTDSGALVSSYKLSHSPTMVWTAPVQLRSHPDFVVIGGLDGHVYVVDTSSGREVAVLATGAEIKSTPALVPLPVARGAEDLIVCNSNGSVLRVRFDAKRSLLTVVWRTEVHAEVYSSPALFGGSSAFLATMQGRIYCLDLEDGRERWVFKDVPDHIAGSPTVSADGVLVVGTSGGRLIALSAQDGRLLGCRVLSEAKRAINASPILVEKKAGSAYIVVGSYDGNIYIVPSTRLLGANDRLTEVDPGVLLQDLTPPGALIRSFRFNGLDMDPDGAVDAAAVRVRPPPIGYRVVVSPEGRYVNFVPELSEVSGGHAPGTAAAATVSGACYRLSNSWLRDRLHAFRSPDCRFSAPIKLPSLLLLHEAIRRGGTLESLRGVHRLDLHRLSARQPAVLDTYIPAALDGIGYACYVFGVDASRRRFRAVMLPAVPRDGSPEPFDIFHEPSKVVAFAGTWREDTGLFELNNESLFTISGMGGTMTFGEFKVLGRISDLVNLCVKNEKEEEATLSFYARASCLRIKGNGESYRFSGDVVNKLCDRFLDAHIIGTCAARRSSFPAVNSNNDEENAAAPELCVFVDGVSGGRVTAGLLSEPPCVEAPGDMVIYGRRGSVVTFPSENEHPSQQPPSSYPCTPRAAASQGQGAPVFSTDAAAVHALAPVVDAACRASIHPNVLTLSSGIAIAGMLYAHMAVASRPARAALVPLLMAYKCIADLLDGPVARRCRMTSALGGVLDSTMDALFLAALLFVYAHLLAPSRVRRSWVLVAVACAAASVSPFLIGAAINGPAALYDHARFKNADNPVNAGLWLLSENSVVVIGIAAVAYMYLLYRPQ